MRHHVQALIAACVLAAAGCADVEQADQPAREQSASSAARALEQADAEEKSSESRLLLDGDGLVLMDMSGSARKIAFGSPASAVVAAASEIYGWPLSVETLDECGAGPMQISRFGGLTIAAQDRKFVGWSLDDSDKAPFATTASGIGIGSSQRDLKRAEPVEVFESSLGQEFTANGLTGLLDGKDGAAKVTHLWAGANCIMR